MSSSIISILKKTYVEDLPQRNVIVISSKSTPVEGFSILLENNILSAPVFDETTQQYVGFLDIRDLVSYVVFAYENQKKIAFKQNSPIYTSLLENVTVTYLARCNPFHPVPKGSTLYDVAEVLSTSVHRVPVVDSNGKIVSIVSQSSLIQLFNHNMESLKSDLNAKISDTLLGTSPVISVTRDTSAIETFRLMDKLKKNAVAIVDNDGQLLTNISAKDLKLFVKSSSSYDILTLPILKFLAEIRNEATDIRALSITCKINEPLEMVIRKLAATRVHRIYIVPESGAYIPLRVVSLTDILKHLQKSR